MRTYWVRYTPTWENQEKPPVHRTVRAEDEAQAAAIVAAELQAPLPKQVGATNNVHGPMVYKFQSADWYDYEVVSLGYFTYYVEVQIPSDGRDEPVAREALGKALSGLDYIIMEVEVE